MTAADCWADLEAKAKAATPGEWKQGRIGDPVGGEHVVDLGEPPSAPFVTFSKGYPSGGAVRGWSPSAIVRSDADNISADAAFIAAANPATILKLIEAARHSQPGAEGGETWESIAAWQRETFGPVELPRQALRAAEEMDELLADPSDVEEAADVCIVLAGYPGIREAVDRKMAKNRARQWNVMGDGTGYHVKSASPQQPATSTDEKVGR